MMRKKFNIKGMTCAACQSHVYNAVSKLDDARNINVNLIANTLELETDNLKDNTYQQKIAFFIAIGIADFISETEDFQNGT